MMNLYLVRHGEAKPKDEDPERPLTESGVKTARRVATFLREAGAVSVAEIRHSTKTRARQTAEIFAEWAALDAATVELPGLGPLDDVTPLATTLLQAAGDLMLVGHLPHLDRLASLLVAGDPELNAFGFDACGVLCLRRRADDDGSVRWTVRWMIVPGLLPA